MATQDPFTLALMRLRPGSDWEAPPAGTIAQRHAGLIWKDQNSERPSLEEVAAETLRAPKLAAIEAEFTRRIALGLAYGGATLQIDDSSQQRLAAVATLALGVEQGQAGMAWPPGFAWRMADNSFLPRSAAQMLSMAQAAAGYVLALRVNRWALRDAVNDAEATAAEIDAVDCDTGWPE